MKDFKNHAEAEKYVEKIIGDYDAERITIKREQREENKGA